MHCFIDFKRLGKTSVTESIKDGSVSLKPFPELGITSWSLSDLDLPILRDGK
jgi:hypothetical protein